MAFTATLKGFNRLERLRDSGTHWYKFDRLSFASVRGRPEGFSVAVELGDESVCIWHADGDALVCEDRAGVETYRTDDVTKARAHSISEADEFIKRRAQRKATL